MKILVTGASGFLGGFLCRTLKAQGHAVIEANSKNCNLTKDNALDVFNDHRFDQIFHLAVWTQAGDFCLRHPGDQWLLNQQINTNMLAWWKKCQPQAKMITMGTSCAYDPAFALSEDCYLKGLPIESLFAYGMTKRMLLCGLMSLNMQYGLDYLYLIPSTLYGPGYHTEGKQLHFIFDLITKIIKGHLCDEPVVLWGNGHQKRELVHVQDFVDTMVKLSVKEKNTIYNLGAGKEHSIREFAQEICDHVGYPFEKIEFDLTRYVGATSKVLINDKLMQIMPEYNPRSLKDGLRPTIDWFMQHEREPTHV